MINILLYIWIAAGVLTLIRHKGVHVVVGFVMLTTIPWVTVLAYQQHREWLAGFATYACVELGLNIIKAINKELS